jgi:type I restriction enzyme R subunit
MTPEIKARQQIDQKLEEAGWVFQDMRQLDSSAGLGVEELHERLNRPPLMLTTERLWNAYARVHESKVKGATSRRQLTELVSVVRFALGLDSEDAELKPFADEVDRRFQSWIFRHNAQRGIFFTQEETEWLRLIKEHIASSCSISRKDFDYAKLADKGGLQKAWGLFGKDLNTLMGEMNEELVA